MAEVLFGCLSALSGAARLFVRPQRETQVHRGEKIKGDLGKGVGAVSLQVGCGSWPSWGRAVTDVR